MDHFADDRTYISAEPCHWGMIRADRASASPEEIKQYEQYWRDVNEKPTRTTFRPYSWPKAKPRVILEA